MEVIPTYRMFYGLLATTGTAVCPLMLIDGLENRGCGDDRKRLRASC